MKKKELFSLKKFLRQVDKYKYIEKINHYLEMYDIDDEYLNYVVFENKILDTLFRFSSKPLLNEIIISFFESYL
jgi:hypothetical protein